MALQVIEEALQEGRLKSGGLITEGTAGSTGISLAMVSQAPSSVPHVATQAQLAGKDAD